MEHKTLKSVTQCLVSINRYMTFNTADILIDLPRIMEELEKNGIVRMYFNETHFDLEERFLPMCENECGVIDYINTSLGCDYIATFSLVCGIFTFKVTKNDGLAKEWEEPFNKEVICDKYRYHENLTCNVLTADDIIKACTDENEHDFIYVCNNEYKSTWGGKLNKILVDKATKEIKLVFVDEDGDAAYGLIKHLENRLVKRMLIREIKRNAK